MSLISFQGSLMRGHDQTRAVEREEKSLTKSLKCRLVGACFKLISHNYISPIEAKSAILLKSVSQSELASIVISRQGACGSEEMFERVVLKNCPPEMKDEVGDSLETIDNNERGSRTYSVKLNSTLKMSLVTARNIYL